MSTYERSIISLIEPDFKTKTNTGGKLVLDEIAIEDSESKDAKDNSENGHNPNDFKNSARAGAFTPLIAINTMKFGDDEMHRMELDMDGKLPSISVTIDDVDNKFGLNAPIDGDVISLYLRPPDADNQKPIRMDFNIHSINSNPETRMYYIYGTIKIPEFFKEVSKSFPEGNSFDHLQDLCEETGLGFATNEESTDDKMTRLCALDTYETFVNDTVFTAYKNDDSFFDWYIDPYYYLCFVNINKQFSLEDKTEEVNISASIPLSGLQGQDDSNENNKGSLVLTNSTTMASKNVFIERYSLKNNSGATWLKNGYKRYAQWLNVGAKDIEYQQAFADPLTTPGAENDFILLKGRRSDVDFYKTQSKYKWMGKQSSILEKGNVHDNYCYSKVLNHQNIEEISKTILEVEISGMNFYLYKYMRIPVTIYESGNPKNEELMRGRNTALGESNKNTDEMNNSTMASLQGPLTPVSTDEEGTPTQKDQIKNEYLSGYYVIKGMKILYRPGEPIVTKLTLSRREWPIPPKNKDV